MSGDVQPRKRKDKKRKKDEGGHLPPIFAEESRGTAAALGEGDVLMHTHSDHGTGGHWCAKLVFFLLLAVLVGLVGLILMENRGLSDIEGAGSESRYAAVFDGWVDEALPDDHHHDEHTLELTNPEDDDEHGGASEEGHEEEEEIEVEDIEKEPEDDNVSEESDDDHNEASDDEGNDTDGEDPDEIEEEDQSVEAFDQDDEEIDRIHIYEDDGDDQSDDEEAQDDNNDDYLEGEEVDDDEQDPVQDSGEVLDSSEKPFEEVDSSEVVEEQQEVVVDNSEAERELQQRLAQEQEQEPEASNQPTGGQSAEEAWPNEPDDKQWRDQLDLAQAELDEGRLEEARTRFAEVLRMSPGSARARYGLAAVLHRLAEERRSNALLASAIDAYKHTLALGDELPDKLFLLAAEKAIDRIRFTGRVLEAVPVHRLLIARFSQDPSHRNNLAISYLMVNKPDDAMRVLEKVLSIWPDDGVALVHYGFVLKSTDTSRLSEAAEYLSRGLTTSHPGTQQGRFYFHLGDALLQLGRSTDADVVHRRAAQLGYFPSTMQRSLYNVDGLTARSWWNIDQTPYAKMFHALEENWQIILKEAYSLKEKYSPEKEGLQTAGSWSQLDVMVRGAEVGGRCAAAPVTCGVVRREAAAAGCRRGQVKFSALEPGTHIRAHVGPTNCRLRAHLGLTNTQGAFLRVHNETRTWQQGKVLIFDDSFEHEVWHNGTGTRLVLIVDVWHPDLTPEQRRTLPAI